MRKLTVPLVANRKPTASRYGCAETVDGSRRSVQLNAPTLA